MRSHAKPRNWRTGDLPWYVVLPGLTVWGLVTLSVSGSAGAFGVVAALVLLALGVGLALLWAGAPTDRPPSAGPDAGADEE